MIKALLKAIFPVVFLKKAFLVYNQAKIKTFDRIFFNEATVRADDFMICRETNPFLTLEIDTGIFSNEIQQKFRIWTDPLWRQDEYLYVCQIPGLIEPETGWAMTKTHNLIYPSLGFARAPHVRKPPFWEAYFKKKKVSKIDSIISLRDTGEENYFHFFNDVIAKLLFIRDSGLNPKQYTVIVSKRLFDKDYFQVVRASSWLIELDFHVQSDEWIEYQKAIFCKPLTHSVKYFREIIEWVRPQPSHHRKRRIFITRDVKTLRFLQNMSELTPVLDSHDFEIVDSGAISFNEQIQLFSHCEILIGIHGAGLTNMIFGEGYPMRVLEIAHPFEYVPFHYIMLARQFHFRYRLILGKTGNFGSGGFWVEPKALDSIIKELI